MKTIVTIHFTLLFGILPLFINAQINAENTEIVKTVGVFKEIDVEKHNRAISILFSDDQKMKDTMVYLIIDKPNNWNPPVLYSLSKEFFAQNKKEEAAFWYYVGQLRARYDANRCQDKSAREAVAVLNDKFGYDINQYTFKDIKKLEKTVDKALEFVRDNEENYDHRWINLHGMWAIIGADNQKKLSYPKKEWPAIKNKTLDDYYKGFLKYAVKK